MAFDYFEPFINETKAYQNFDFLENWSAFVQKLSNLFGSYSLEDDDENTIIAIPFPNDGKAVNYFIQFAKFQNWIRWDNRALRKVVKNAIPDRIHDELRFSHEDVSTFEGLKRAVMRIDNDFWKRQQEGKHKFQASRAIQGYTPKVSRLIQERPPPALEGTTLTDKLFWDCIWRPLTQYSFSCTEQSLSGTSSILGPDGWLTSIERQHRISLGLCIRCGQSSHLARSCSKQAYQLSGPIEAHASYVDQLADSLELSKNNLAVTSHSGESTA